MEPVSITVSWVIVSEALTYFSVIDGQGGANLNCFIYCLGSLNYDNTIIL